MRSLKKGFTLVELMVVIVIIGILAALAIPRFLGATNKAKATEFKPVLKQIYTLQTAYMQEKDTASGDATGGAIGFDKPDSVSRRFDYTVNKIGTKWGMGVVRTGAIKGVDGTPLTSSTGIAWIDSTGVQAALTGLAQLSNVTAAASAP